MGKLSHRSQFGPFVVPALNQGFSCLWYDWFCRFELWLMWPQREKKVAWSFFSKGWSLHQNSLSSGLLFHLGWQERWCQLMFRPQLRISLRAGAFSVLQLIFFFFATTTKKWHYFFRWILYRAVNTKYNCFLSPKTPLVKSILSSRQEAKRLLSPEPLPAKWQERSLRLLVLSFGVKGNKLGWGAEWGSVSWDSCLFSTRTPGYWFFTRDMLGIQ